MLKTALVLFADGFEDIEAVAPVDILTRAGIQVTTAGVNSKTVKGSRGTVLTANKTLEEAGSVYDALILPGGSEGSRNLAASSGVNLLILEIHKKGGIIAAICAAPALVLSPLGILDGRKATCYPGLERQFTEKTVYAEEPVVVDENIITSRGVGTTLDFSLMIVEKLLGIPVRKKLEKELLLER